MNYHFAATLTEADVKRHIPHHLELPAHCTQLTLRLHFEPPLVNDVRNMLTLTLFDPDGFRGAGHRGGNTHIVEITPTTATPGYRAGRLPAGAWTVQIDTHMIMPGECRYELTVTATVADKPANATSSGAPLDATSVIPAIPRFDYVANPNPGWYRGDLHSHTVHSDASWSVQELAAAARRLKLDFIALTDHNTTTPLAEMERLSTPGFLTMGGQELTTFWGHAVCLGAHEWLDWRVTQQGEEMAQIASQLYAQEQLFIIAHPKDVGDPICTGCRWVYPLMMPGTAQLVEIWNEAWVEGHSLNQRKNEDGLALWYQWLNEGRRMVATAGSDVHGPKGYATNPGFNVVYAAELSERAILRAIAAGHLYLSSGPTLEVTASTAAGATAMIGDQLPVTAHAAVDLQIAWGAAPPESNLRLITNGVCATSQPIGEAGALQSSIADPTTRWVVIEVRGQNNVLLAITNPIFFTLI
ncbi:MAG: CehA/McbA family metallohydrolase [Caldilineaceae bacterium]